MRKVPSAYYARALERFLLIIAPDIIIFHIFFFPLFPFFQFFFLVPIPPGCGFRVGAVGVAARVRINLYLSSTTVPLIQEYAIKIVTTNTRHFQFLLLGYPSERLHVRTAMYYSGAKYQISTGDSAGSDFTPEGTISKAFASTSE
jgi:hypothetical protein